MNRQGGASRLVDCLADCLVKEVRSMRYQKDITWNAQATALAEKAVACQAVGEGAFRGVDFFNTLLYYIYLVLKDADRLGLLIYI